MEEYERSMTTKAIIIIDVSLKFLFSYTAKYRNVFLSLNWILCRIVSRYTMCYSSVQRFATERNGEVVIIHSKNNFGYEDSGEEA